MTKKEKKQHLEIFEKTIWSTEFKALTIKDFHYHWVTFFKKKSKNYKKNSTIDKKVKNIFTLMELLVEEKEIKSNDVKIAKMLECTTKTLGRYLEDITNLYGNIIQVKKGRPNIYEFVDISYVFEKVITNTDDLYWFFDLIERWDANIFKDIGYEISKKEKDVFLYKNSPFEELKSDKQKDIFRSLKSAIINQEYRDIDYIYDAPRTHRQAIPLKLIFMEQNWYVAIIDKDEGFRFLRILFIRDVRNSAKRAYDRDLSKKEYKETAKFLKTFQNPMSRYLEPKEIARIKASPKVAKYFDKNMKQHLNSQTFIKKNIDGSIEFSLEYTQSIEVLPLIKRWLPDLKIISPKSLEDKLREDLKNYLK
jgi:predicted DNA-binding transcriptional regulator YafY